MKHESEIRQKVRNSRGPAIGDRRAVAPNFSQK